MPPSSKRRRRYATRIRDARERGNMTQAEMADEIEVTARTVQDWEAGKAWPQPRHRRRLERLFPELAELTAAI